VLTKLRRAFPVFALLACAGLSISAAAQSSSSSAAQPVPRTREVAQVPVPIPLTMPRAGGNAMEQTLATRDWSRKMWDAARGGDQAAFYALLDKVPADGGDPQLAAVRVSALRLKANYDKREADRIKRHDEVMVELDKALSEPRSDVTISKGLISVVELHMLAINKKAILREPKINELVTQADNAARSAEERADWLTASELFYRLSALFEDEGTYKTDSDRLNHRLEMLRLYVPERLWELRNARQLAAGLEKLPPYNPAGDDFREKLAAVDEPMVVSAVTRAGTKHVEQVPLKDVLIGGLRGVRTMATTTDLQRSFKGLANPVLREQLLQSLDREEEKIRAAQVALDFSDVDGLLQRLMKANRDSVAMNDQSLLHEFGNGSMEALDPFSKIFWPDELARFNRSTQGKLIGIGVEIQFDELSNIRVVTPLEGGPALKVGVRAGDVIKKIDGKSAYGLTLDQAVDLITGRAGTQVGITMERKDPSKPADAKASELEFSITRAEVELKSVKGWKRQGSKEDDWNWFVDPVNKIGYARITGFTDGTTRELDRAIRAMKAGEVRGLVLDLRFNPGGLLDEAVKVVNRFIDRGLIVSTQLPGKRTERQEVARRNLATLNKLPVVVLINEGSASASEIVSGAIQDYARRDVIKAITLGSRSYGKGSVQDVTSLGGGVAAMKLTTQYYLLPDGRLIHRKEGAKEWGVPADLTVEMLPAQITDALVLRRNADVLPLDENGKLIATAESKADPDDLIAKGLDLQLNAAVVLLQSQTLGTGEQASKDQ